MPPPDKNHIPQSSLRLGTACEQRREALTEKGGRLAKGCYQPKVHCSNLEVWSIEAVDWLSCDHSHWLGCCWAEENLPSFLLLSWGKLLPAGNAKYSLPVGVCGWREWELPLLASWPCFKWGFLLLIFTLSPVDPRHNLVTLWFLWPHLPVLSPSLRLFQPHWPLCCSLHTCVQLLPQGLCIISSSSDALLTVATGLHFSLASRLSSNDTFSGLLAGSVSRHVTLDLRILSSSPPWACRLLKKF